MILPAATVASALHLHDVTDMQVVENSSGRAAAVRVLAAGRWTRFPGVAIRKKFKLGSTDFAIRALTLDALPERAPYGTHVRVGGWLRGLGRARLQMLTDQGWTTVRHVRPDAGGHFIVSLPATRSTELRLAYNGVAGDTVSLDVVPRVSLQAVGTKLHVQVVPRLPLRIERLTKHAWRPVARSTGRFDRSLRPGSYRVEILGGNAYASSVSRPVALHRPTV